MANYEGRFSTNFFKVKDIDAFKSFVEKLSCEDQVEVFTEKNEKYGTLVACGAYGSIPCSIIDESGDNVDIDFIKDLSSHLVEGWVAIVMEAGFEKLCYFTGYACAVNHKGEQKELSINDIYPLARKLGDKFTSF